METHHVDVFTHGSAGGNPLAVVVHDGNLDERVRVALARDLDSAEVACICRGADPAGARPLRVLRSLREIPFSGHAALGAAWVIRHRVDPDRPERVRLELPLGDVVVRFEAGPDGAEVAWLGAPTIELGSTWPAAQVYRALGLRGVSSAGLPPVQLTSAGVPILLVPVPDLAALGACALDGPGFRAFAVRMVRHKALHAVVYAFCRQAREAGHDLAARLFLAGPEDAEDPASGAAAVCLGAYLLRHEGLWPGGGDLVLEQGYEIGRPSLLRLRVAAAGGGPAIAVGGAVRPAGGG